MDYGDLWEAAWTEHVKNHEPVEDTRANPYHHGSQYASAWELNSILQDMPLRTVDELMFDPYPPNVETRCHADLVKQTDDSYVWGGIGSYGYWCEVVERYMEDGMLWYKVRIDFTKNEAEDLEDSADGEWIFQDQVPREAIRFYNLPGTSDIHLPKAFRQPIGLPDDMLPDQWRNVEEEEDG